jgi:hypothetical protein
MLSLKSGRYSDPMIVVNTVRLPPSKRPRAARRPGETRTRPVSWMSGVRSELA